MWILSSRGTKVGSVGMDDMSEVKDLLREIRDLLKADLEMTKAFRQSALTRQQARDEDIKRAREEERHFRDQMGKQVHETIKSPWAFLVYVGTLVVLAGCAIYVIMFSSSHR
jgi:hypothetical protein